ncbi:MAG TPA: tetratricopeptide repeat protein [Acidobacteriota bacterium]|nr:tetratricopeptide repeat protein [Acidobacteriota bacterium]
MATDNKTKLLHDAEKYVLQGKIPQAIAEYLKIIKTDPDDVLTLNTIGDLFLRQGKVSEANSYFSRVAENYARNNFFLKSIAVYKKILNADPNNLEINLTLASLYLKQGQNVEARNLYQRVAELCAKEGKTRESRDAYEKVVEIDPQNYSVQLKLAEIHLAEGSKDKAQANFAGAARAQVKAGDLNAALASFRRAIQLSPLDVEVMRGFLEASIQLGEVIPALEQLRKSLAIAPDNPTLHGMLGQACLANKDAEGALAAFQFVISQDDSRYQDFIPVSKAFLEAGDYDMAAACLDPIIPTLITRRETEKAVEAYTLILSSNQTHILTLTKLAAIYSATNDQNRQLDVLDRIAGCYLSLQSPREAIEYLDKYLTLSPASEKHLKLHRQAFAEAYPDSPYVPPAATREPSRQGLSAGVAIESHLELGGEGESSNPGVVEVDLLLNYGMREKAMSMLQSLVNQDPTDKDVHLRMLNIYREDQNSSKAADECLILAALHRRAENEEAAAKYMAEARKLDPDSVPTQFDLAAFARKRGLPAEFAEPAQKAAGQNIEVDLSGDLSEMFFKESGEAEPAVENEPHGTPEVVPAAAEFMHEIPPMKAPSESVQEQLQEVDFYIRLGFLDEAKTKLDEIARNYPNNPELPLRYRQLSEEGKAHATVSAAPAPVPAQTGSGADASSELDLDGAIDRSVERKPSAPPPAAQAQSQAGRMAEGIKRPPGAETEGGEEGPVNTMFADLLDEVNTISDQEIAREEFDTHFSLGIAYREMELTEDAIKEFQSAFKALNPAKHPKEVIQCCGMLSTCFLEKGMPRSAIRWCQTGLSISGISAHENLALRYDMGVAHSSLGDFGRALECFEQIYAVDPSYRDVTQKIDSLKGSSDQHAS